MGCRCGIYKTTDMEKMKEHIEAVHRDPSLHEWQTCGQCEMKTKTWTDLKEHIQMSHPLILFPQSKPVCGTCRAVFESASDLLLHRKMQAFCQLKCKECPVSFASEKDLIEHVSAH